MSLNDWSLIVFGFSAVYYVTIYYSIFRNPTPGKFGFLAIVWAINSIVTLFYGIATDQIGFILLFFLEWIMIIISFIESGRVIKDASQ